MLLAENGQRRRLFPVFQLHLAPTTTRTTTTSGPDDARNANDTCGKQSGGVVCACRQASATATSETLAGLVTIEKAAKELTRTQKGKSCSFVFAFPRHNGSHYYKQYLGSQKALTRTNEGKTSNLRTNKRMNKENIWGCLEIINTQRDSSKTRER